MKMDPERGEQQQANFVIDRSIYTEDESSEFDRLLRSRETTTAPRDGLSEKTRDMLLYSGWHVPCHCIVTRDEDGFFQAFHVQPNKLGPTDLTYEQEKALRAMGRNGGHAIVAKGQRSSFYFSDKRDLERMALEVERVIDVDTDQWWRLLYDPRSNELWIDDKIKHELTKYVGFAPATDRDVTPSP